MLIGFTNKTSKKLSKIICKRFRHCAVLFDSDNKKHKYLFVQIAKDGIRIIPMGIPEIKLLESNGWVFIGGEKRKVENVNYPNMLTCVGFAKRALGINKPFIWTPDQLYRYLNKI